MGVKSSEYIDSERLFFILRVMRWLNFLKWGGHNDWKQRKEVRHDNGAKTHDGAK